LALILALFLVLLIACDENSANNGASDMDVTDAVTDTQADDAVTQHDSATDAHEDTEAADTTDAASDSSSDTAVDTGNADTSTEDASDARDTEQDTGEDTADNTADTGDAFAGRPLGQCTQNSDCPDGPNGQVCSEALPGGACQGCGSDADCPAIASCSQFGTCVGDCSEDSDCAPGLYCTASGRCAAQSCVNGECPVPLFGCSDSDRCKRIDCSTDATLCPEDTTCTNGWCIEDRALR
jgi:hypothetical protein